MTIRTLSLLLISLVCLRATRAVAATNTPAAPQPSTTITGARAADDHYRLQVSDRIDLDYRYSPEYNETLTVQPDGFVTLSLVGGVKVDGLSLAEARTRIVNAVRSRLNDPEVNVTLAEYVHPAFTVMGQVGAPGKYDIHGDVSLVEAIAIAGGFKDKGQRTKVVVYRHLDADRVETRVINVKKMLAQTTKGGVDDMIAIHSGDFIMVPKTYEGKVGDYVGWVGFHSAVPQ